MSGRLQVADVLPHGVGGALIPVGTVERLLGGEDFDEAAVERIERVGAADVPMQADGVELRQHVDPVHAAIDAIRDRHVDQPILAGQRHRRLGAKFGERIKPRSPTAAEHESEDVFHRSIMSPEESSIRLFTRHIPCRQDAGVYNSVPRIH